MENKRDLSGAFVSKSPVLLKAEKPLPFNEFLYHSRARDKHTEFLILKKITETPAHSEYLDNDLNHCLLNRYKDILPYRDTKVILASGDYINASILSVAPCYENCLIAAQAPLSNTCYTFWKMVWEQEVRLVVMCCGFVENDVPKCFEYFPIDSMVSFEDIEIRMINQKQKFEHTIKRTLILSYSGSERKITHLEILGWEDNSVPNIKESFSALNYTIFMIQHKIKKHQGKVVVHCSAGIGRTGVLIGLFSMVMQLESPLDEVNSISVFKTVRKLREQRWGMVANEDQYRFMYSFMEYWITTFLLQ
jgi:protein tyrosine phosphatase